MRQDTYVPKCYEEDFLKFKAIHGKHTSRELMYLMRKSLQ